MRLALICLALIVSPFCFSQNRDSLAVAQINQQYQSCIHKADSLYSLGRWQQAGEFYRNANSVKPSEKYPKDQIASCDMHKKNEAEKVKDSLNYVAYLKEIYIADSLFNNQEWHEAKNHYRGALTIVPGDPHTTAQLGQCNQKIHFENECNAYIKRAEDFIVQKLYVKAWVSYEKALEFDPENIFVKEKMDLIRPQVLAEKLDSVGLAKKDSLISIADTCASIRDYDCALLNYKMAHELDPLAPYPSHRLIEIKQLQKFHEFNQLVAEADSLIELGYYHAGWAKYDKALLLIPSDTTVAGKKKRTEIRYSKLSDLHLSEAEKAFSEGWGSYEVLIDLIDSALIIDPLNRSLQFYAAKFKLLESSGFLACDETKFLQQEDSIRFYFNEYPLSEYEIRYDPETMTERRGYFVENVLYIGFVTSNGITYSVYQMQTLKPCDD